MDERERVLKRIQEQTGKPPDRAERLLTLAGSPQNLEQALNQWIKEGKQATIEWYIQSKPVFNELDRRRGE